MNRSALLVPLLAGCTGIEQQPDAAADSGTYYAPLDAIAFDTGIDSGVEAGCKPAESICNGSCVNLSTDAVNCGSCARDCKGFACDGGVCAPTVLAANLDIQTTAIAVDDNNVYFVATAGLMRVPKTPTDGGAPVLLAPAMGPREIAVDATHVYWANYDTDGGVMKVPIDGGAVTPLATNQWGAAFVAVDSANVYWTTIGDNQVRMVPINGGQPTVLATGQKLPSYIAVDTANVYWTNLQPGGGMKKCPIDGGAPVDLVPTMFSMPRQLAVDSTNVYYTDMMMSGGAMKVSKNGGNPTWLGGTSTVPDAIAFDGTSVYWVGTFSEIAKVSINGGPTTIVAKGSIAALAVDTTSLYWVGGGKNGQVLKAPK